jgi:hypothetical protein
MITQVAIRFPLRNIEAGLHTITFKAWDVYNNPVTAEISLWLWVNNFDECIKLSQSICELHSVLVFAQ